MSFKWNDAEKDVFVHVSTVERAGMDTLTEEGQKVSFDIVADRRTGRAAAVTLRAIRLKRSCRSDHGCTGRASDQPRDCKGRGLFA